MEKEQSGREHRNIKPDEWGPLNIKKPGKEEFCTNRPCTVRSSFIPPGGRWRSESRRWINMAFLLVGIALGTGACRAQEVPGCTDPLASNYDPSATVDDGSCTYDQMMVSPLWSRTLSDSLRETSGLVFMDGNLLSHNDSDDTLLYELDTVTAAVTGTYSLNGADITDWESVAQDDIHLYVGDFGNNSSGNRTDLQILKIRKSALGDVGAVERIAFVYDDQVDFTPKEGNQTDFDCEAMVVLGDSIYLFTKQWISGNSAVYMLPKTAGSHRAMLSGTIPVEGLVTGASYSPLNGVVVLCGYSPLLQPFLYMLYDFKGSDLLSGHQRKIDLELDFHQVEGIATADGMRYYLTNERLVKEPFIHILAKLHLLDLKSFLIP